MLQLPWFLIAAAAAIVAILFHAWIPYIAVAIFVTAFLAWTLISVLSPAVPDRKCPQCGGNGLVKIRRGEPGVCCELCGFRDEAMHVAYLDDW